MKPELHLIDGFVRVKGEGDGGGSRRLIRIRCKSDDRIGFNETFTRMVDLDIEGVR
jgi:uncharacterized protein (DUF362 family)